METSVISYQDGIFMALIGSAVSPKLGKDWTVMMAKYSIRLTLPCFYDPRSRGFVGKMFKLAYSSFFLAHCASLKYSFVLAAVLVPHRPFLIAALLQSWRSCSRNPTMSQEQPGLRLL
jgi:hypothetical protein